ncbi:carboxymuconolactone decarboxylase family protein [Niveispirillum sp. KHB5.9]|uniref:carboxymuconolactone decarboxylase family protein n=1 Tax=Niveispirillum sp. KHB5.9 TaxID=3400269 RepID=UPI003A8396EB
MKRPSAKKGNELAAVVPTLVELTDRVLYEDVWERPGLSKRDRSLVTIAALISMYRPEQLPAHLGLALDNGLTKEEIGEAIAHLAFYASWPSAISASRKFLEVVEEREAKGKEG